MNDMTLVLESQREFFYSGATKPIDYRKEQLRALRRGIQDLETEIMAALFEDLKKSSFESYVTEIGMVLEEISYMLSHMSRYLKAKKVRTPITQFPAVSRVYKEPYGNVLIMAPWNYPFQLALAPLIGAIACGNCAIIKPSEYAPATSSVIRKLIEATFQPSYIQVIEGGLDVNQALLEQRFDLIFFTGSTMVGKIVMEKAARHLTPVVLELGGKCPCIVDETADLKLAGKRIAWGKSLNSSQTCVAPDYLLVHKKVKSQLIEEIKGSIRAFYSDHPENHPDYPGMINQRHFDRISQLIATGEVIFGGEKNERDCKISLALMDHVGWEDPVMEDELFGPLLPIIEYEDIDEILQQINKRPKPLALYLFTNNRRTETKVIDSVSFGGGCINDIIVHLATSNMGFGGVGESGMGSYHGKASMDTFSRKKSILKKSNRMDIPLRYPPYGEKKLSLVKRLMN